MRIAVGADHAGYNLKEILVPWLKGLDYEITDLGASTLDPSDDYPDLALPVAQAISPGAAEKGIIIWKFENAVDIEIACNVPGHYQAGMIAAVNLD